MPAPKDPAAYARFIERLKAAHTGKSPSPETRAKMSAAQTARKRGPRPDMVGDLNPMRRAAVAEKVAAVHRGAPKSDAQRAKIAATLKGRYAGAANGNWNGEDCGYAAVHQRAKRVLPRVCSHCGATEGRLDCALRRDAPIDSIRTSPQGRYSVAWPPDLAYFRLCKKCHATYDGLPRRYRAPSP